MPLPLSGSFGMYNVNLELGNSGTASLDLNNANVRNLANIPSGAIGFSDLRGSLKMSMGYAYTYSTYYTLVQAQYGYYSGSYGGVTNTSFGDGKTLYYMTDIVSYGSYSFNVAISGFSSNPGITGYFTSVKKHGGTSFNASAASYSYGAGYGYWTWSGSTGFTTSGTAWCKFT
jgi:hypothetical protein